jgi:uncharacterized OB-fold protein
MPIPNPETKAFWRACQERELRFQRCLSCGHMHWNQAVVCPQCLSREAEWLTSQGKGLVYTFAVYHQAFHPAFEDQAPYVVAVVALADGPRILSNIVGCDPAEVRCDLPVEVVWEDIGQDVVLPKFKPMA